MKKTFAKKKWWKKRKEIKKLAKKRREMSVELSFEFIFV